jgi:uncharacterized protein YycO
MPDFTGQIGLIAHPRGFWPRVIAWATRSPFYHSVLAVDNTRAVSAEPGGAVFRPLNFWPDTIWSDFDLTAEQKEDITDWAVNHIRTPYNFLDDLAIGLALIFGLHTPKWIQSYLSSDYTLECAQLCDAAYRAAGIQLFDDGRLPGAVYPGLFAPIWQKNHWMP